MIIHGATLLTSLKFGGQADAKMNQAILRLNQSEFPVEDVCGPGVDSTFDQLLAALGHISRQKPRPLIKTIMLWRSDKGDEVRTAKEQIAHQVCHVIQVDLLLSACHKPE